MEANENVVVTDFVQWIESLQTKTNRPICLVAHNGDIVDYQFLAVALERQTLSDRASSWKTIDTLLQVSKV